MKLEPGIQVPAPASPAVPSTSNVGSLNPRNVISASASGTNPHVGDSDIPITSHPTSHPGPSSHSVRLSDQLRGQCLLPADGDLLKVTFIEVLGSVLGDISTIRVSLAWLMQM